MEETDLYVPSDTIFAAVLATSIELGYSPEWVTGFPRQDSRISEKNVPFLLTSAFPRAGQVRFYPLPPLQVWAGPFMDQHAIKDRLKELKKIKYVSEGIFQLLVDGASLQEYLPAKDDPSKKDRLYEDDKGLYLQGSLWLTANEVEKLPERLRKKQVKRKDKEKDEIQFIEFESKTKQYKALCKRKVWETGKVPRVTIDRINNSSAIFHTGRLTFSPDCGLWFGIEWRDKELLVDQRPIRDMVETVLENLADMGLGGERSVGHGQFNLPEPTEQTWPDPEPDERFITLSRYHPHSEAELESMQASYASYQLIPVGGWLYSQQEVAQRRRRVWLVAEGSVLKAINDPLGNIVDVRPVYDKEKDFPSPTGIDPFPHPVWRYGLACGVKLGECHEK
jgi:CRISPR-associated protein Csm4